MFSCSSFAVKAEIVGQHVENSLWRWNNNAYYGYMWSSVWTCDPSAGLAFLGKKKSDRKHWEIVRFWSPLCPVQRQAWCRPGRCLALVASGHGALTARVRRSCSERIPWELLTQQAAAAPCQARVSHIQLFRDVDVWLAPSSEAWWGLRCRGWGDVRMSVYN